MDAKAAEKARNLLNTLDRLDEIKQITEKEKSHWWALLTPDTKRWEDDGVMMPEILRDEFKEAIERAITKTKSKLDKL